MAPPVPHLGVGVGYRSPIRREIIEHARELGFLEIITDSFFRNEKGLHALSTLVPCVPHSLNLSVGSRVDPEYLEKVARLVEIVKPPWHTDHLAFTRERDVHIGHLAPVPYTEESLRLVVENVNKIQAAIGRPFGLENITMPFYWPNNEMEEHVFINEVVKRTGCYLLIDLENVRVNGANYGRNGKSFIDKLPLERVVQLHIAGGTHGDDGLEHDTHSAPVSEETWGLVEYFCDLVTPPGILIERDTNFPPFPELLAEVRRAKGILEKRAS